MNGFVTAILTIIIFVGLISIIYIINYNDLQAYKIKINEAEAIIDDYLRRKYDLLENVINLILSITKLEEKNFEDFFKLKKQNISSFDFERNLTEFNKLVDKIKLDYKEISINEEYNKINEDIFEINEKLEATKSFYNKYTGFLNKKVKRFPSNLIAFIHHIRVQSFFDGKDLFDDEINDFKL